MQSSSISFDILFFLFGENKHHTAQLKEQQTIRSVHIHVRHAIDHIQLFKVQMTQTTKKTFLSIPVGVAMEKGNKYIFNKKFPCLPVTFV